MAQVIYISGGARSGKSGYAQRLAEACPGPLLYVATAGVFDGEMAERVARHQRQRGDRWSTLEEPLDLSGRLPGAQAGQGAILLDCVTLWITNLLFHHGEETAPVFAAVEEFIRILPSLEAPLFLVSNELGQGIVPENSLARLFRDLAGEVNQRLASVADEAYLVVSGLPLRLK
jgi:adenosylcobinamide kinase/adenosylcobinamide-phosphate guanylyltransferase